MFLEIFIYSEYLYIFMLDNKKKLMSLMFFAILMFSFAKSGKESNVVTNINFSFFDVSTTNVFEFNKTKDISLETTNACNYVNIFNGSNYFNVTDEFYFVESNNCLIILDNEDYEGLNMTINFTETRVNLTQDVANLTFNTFLNLVGLFAGSFMLFGVFKLYQKD